MNDGVMSVLGHSLRTDLQSITSDLPSTSDVSRAGRPSHLGHKATCAVVSGSTNAPT